MMPIALFDGCEPNLFPWRKSAARKFGKNSQSRRWKTQLFTA